MPVLTTNVKPKPPYERAASIISLGLLTLAMPIVRRIHPQSANAQKRFFAMQTWSGALCASSWILAVDSHIIFLFYQGGLKALLKPLLTATTPTLLLLLLTTSTIFLFHLLLSALPLVLCKRWTAYGHRFSSCSNASNVEDLVTINKFGTEFSFGEHCGLPLGRGHPPYIGER